MRLILATALLLAFVMMTPSALALPGGPTKDGGKCEGVSFAPTQCYGWKTGRDGHCLGIWNYGDTGDTCL